MPRAWLRHVSALIALTGLLFAASAEALPPGFTQETIGGSWNEAVGLSFAADGRMFVWERGGRIWSVDANGVKGAQPVLDISDEVGGWRDFGLLGVALHPNFLANGYVYLLYVVDRHHLMNAGTASYNPASDEYFAATIGRITRYTLQAATNFQSTDYASRRVLLGETAWTGCPILHQSHGTGSLVFGSDGTLLAACGDGASYSSTDVGSASETYYAAGLADGIIAPKENVGALRAQLPDSHSGKLLRLDPETGDGLPSNPLFDAARPRSARSRLWALGLRNPYRMTLRPGTGSHDPDAANPGALYIGDVGWGTWEDIHVSDAPGQNFGWPLFEGIDPSPDYTPVRRANLDAPNPLYGQDVPGVGLCTKQYFDFQDLILQATLVTSPSFPNSCDPSQQIPASIPKWIHERPKIDYRHGSGPSRWTSFSGTSPVTTNIGPGTDPNGKSVPGPQFGGNTSTAGVWYVGVDFPAEYQNSYFHGDYGSQWIRNFRFDANDEPTLARDFHGGGGGIVHIATHPLSGALYYIQWTAVVWKISWVGIGNQPPSALASLDTPYGASPHAVSFQGDLSSDPESGALVYDWNFGDGSPPSNAPNPVHTFTASGPTPYTVTLTVTDPGGLTDQTTLLVSVNNTPPAVAITSPADGTLYPLSGTGTSYPLSASISDLEQAGGFTCSWVTALHHNEHTHAEPPVNSCAPAQPTTISPVGCDGNSYFWRVTLRVTDDAGLTTERHSDLFPDCPNVAPIAIGESVSVAQGYAIDIDVLANDFDTDGSLDPASVSIVTAPLDGTTSVDPSTGVITYTHSGVPDPSDSFSYQVADDDGLVSAPATISISSFNTAPQVTLISPVDLATWSAGQSIPLSASASDAEDGPGVERRFEIRRIRNATLEPPFLTFYGPTPPAFNVPTPSPGDRISYLVTVIATDLAGVSSSDEALLVPAVPPANGVPNASFVATPLLGSAPLSVGFNASSSSDPNGDYLVYRWSFGDGGTATGVAATHLYSAEGSFTVTLTVIDAAGAQDTQTVVVQVLSPGLQGAYYDNMNLTTLRLTRIDPLINFDWGAGSPDPLIGINTFSVRWTGQMEPLYSELYTLYTRVDDGVRLWIDGVQVINSWIDQAPTERSGSIALMAGHKHDIVLEYYENGGGAVIELRWSSPSQSKQIVPESALFPPPPPNQAPLAVDDVTTVFTGFPSPIDVLANDLDDRGEIDAASVVASQPAHGTTSVHPTTGVVTYTHDGSAFAADSFTYRASDQDGALSNLATVSINVLEPSGIRILAPGEGALLTGPDVVVSYELFGDPSLYDHLHFTLDAEPTIMDFSLGGVFTFPGVSPGQHTIVAELVDGQHSPLGFPESSDSVTIAVVAPNPPPVALSDAATVVQGESVAIAVLGNDSDDQALDPASVSVLTPPGKGSATPNPATGVVTYAHAGADTSPDTFSYRVSDLEGASSGPASVAISVLAALILDGVTGDSSVLVGEPFIFSATASERGAPQSLVFDWDLDGDGAYDDLAEAPGSGTQTSGGSTAFAAEGVYGLGVRVRDGGYGEVTGHFQVTVTAPQVPSLPPAAHWLLAGILLATLRVRSQRTRT